MRTKERMARKGNRHTSLHSLGNEAVRLAAQNGKWAHAMTGILQYTIDCMRGNNVESLEDSVKKVFAAASAGLTNTHQSGKRGKRPCPSEPVNVVPSKRAALTLLDDDEEACAAQKDGSRSQEVMEKQEEEEEEEEEREKWRRSRLATTALAFRSPQLFAMDEDRSGKPPLLISLSLLFYTIFLSPSILSLAPCP